MQWGLVPPVVKSPHSPILLARFGLRALLSASTLARRSFKQQRARALFAGLAAHSFLPLELPVSAAFGLVLGAAGHAVGWPVAGGGAQKITDALVQHFRSLGGKIETNAPVHELDDLPRSRVILFDITPRQLSHAKTALGARCMFILSVHLGSLLLRFRANGRPTPLALLRRKLWTGKALEVIASEISNRVLMKGSNHELGLI